MLLLQAQYYSAPHSQFRFFQRLAQAFVRVGLIDDGRVQGAPMFSYMPGSTLSVKDTVSCGLGNALGLMEESRSVSSVGSKAQHSVAHPGARPVTWCLCLTSYASGGAEGCPVCFVGALTNSCKLN